MYRLMNRLLDSGSGSLSDFESGYKQDNSALIYLPPLQSRKKSVHLCHKLHYYSKPYKNYDCITVQKIQFNLCKVNIAG